MSLLNSLIEKHIEEHRARLALLSDPLVQMRIKLLESLMAELTAAGFYVFAQDILTVNLGNNDARLFLHVNICKNYGSQGRRRLMALLDARGGCYDGHESYEENGAEIRIVTHTNVDFGWREESPVAETA